MRRSSHPVLAGRRFAAALAAAAALSVAWATGAAAQAACSGVQVGAQVVINSPKGGSVTAPFVVRGQVSATLPVSEVYLFIDGELAASQSYSPSTNVPFEFSVNANQAPPGSHSLKAVACGAGLGLVRGESGTVTVEVQRPPTTTAAPPPPTVPPPTTVGTPVTTVVAGATSSSSSTSTPAAKKDAKTVAIPEIPGPPTPGNDRLEETLADAPFDRPITLTEDRDKGDRAPIWVGLVVGLSGAAGLALSGLLRHRSGSSDEPPDDEQPLPVDPGEAPRRRSTVSVTSSQEA